MITPEPIKSGFDFAGIGKVAQAIPSEVYKQTTATVLKTFESLVAPLTQTADGMGRLIRQTFDTWIEVRQAIGTYTLQQAVIRAKARMEKQGKTLQPPTHPKTFIRALEEGSLETDSVMHEMWVNLLASSLSDRDSHPRLVSILSQLGPAEARLLGTLQPYPKNPRMDHFLGGSKGHSGMKTSWVSDLDGPDQPWNVSVTSLCQQSLADISPIKDAKSAGPVLLHLTPFGMEFLAIVAPTEV
jgi:hypothetical protein